jgi:hypothetical protein
MEDGEKVKWPDQGTGTGKKLHTRKMFAQRIIGAARPIAKLPVARAAMSTWGDIKMGPPDPILGVTEAFKVRNATAQGARPRFGSPEHSLPHPPYE